MGFYDNLDMAAFDDSIPSVGDHLIIIRKAEEAESSNGNPMLKLQYEILEGGEEGKFIFDNVVMTEKTMFRVKRFHRALGYDVDQGERPESAEELCDKEMVVSVNHEEYDGEMRPRVKAYKSA